MNTYPVLVIWHDAKSGGGGWQTPEDLKTTASGPFVSKSVGWIISKDALGVVLAQSITSAGTAADWINIPKGMIKSIRRLR